jgi:serine/threonine protein kinase
MAVAVGSQFPDDLTWIMAIYEGRKDPLPDYEVAKQFTTIKTIIIERKQLQLEVVKKFAIDMFHALLAVVSVAPNQYIPNTVSPVDFVVTTDLKPVLVAFLKRGTDEFNHNLSSRECQTRRIFFYKAPEAVMDQASDKTKALVWSVGVIIHELATSMPPFATGRSLEDHANQIVNVSASLNFSWHNLLTKLLDKNVENRPDISQAITLFENLS